MQFIIKYFYRLLAFLLYPEGGVSRTNNQQYSANMLAFYFPENLLSNWTMSLWNHSPCSSETAPKFPGKNIQVWVKEMHFQWLVASHSLVPWQQFLDMSDIITLFLLLKTFIHAFIHRYNVIFVSGSAVPFT